MKIGGFQKTSLLDFPDIISAIIWTQGCNFHCPFCYNRDLVEGSVKLIPEEEIISFLKKRKKLLEGLVISGGEPLLQKDIAEFISKIKKLGYKVKIDTNGTYPKKLKELIEKKLIDYVSMDVKAPKNKYDKLSGVKTDIKKIEESIGIIQRSDVDYEFKTTFIPNLLTKEDIISIAKWLEGSKKFFLQQFKNDVPLVSSNLSNISAYPKDELIKVYQEIKPFFKYCNVRGI